MRYAHALLLILLATPASAQDRVFRASSIDLEQNERLDSLESRLAALEAKPELLPLPTPKATLAPAAKPPVVARPKPTPQPQVAARSATLPARYTLAELRSMIRSRRPGGWRGAVYADVSPRSQVWQHLVGREHGFSWEQVSGLTQSEALILHDLAPGHGNQIFPTRRGSVSTQSKQITTQSYQFSSFGATQASSAGCANGQCARQTRLPILRRIFR